MSPPTELVSPASHQSYCLPFHSMVSPYSLYLSVSVLSIHMHSFPSTVKFVFQSSFESLVFFNVVDRIIMARMQECFTPSSFVLHLSWLGFATGRSAAGIMSNSLTTINSCGSTHAASRPFCWNPDGFISFRQCSFWGGMAC